MAKGNSTTERCQYSLFKSTRHYVLFPNVDSVVYDFFQYFRRLPKFGYIDVVGVIIIASIISVSSAKSHNNRFRYNPVSIPRNPYSNHSDKNTIFIVTFRNYHTPVPNTLKDIHNLKHDSISKVLYPKRIIEEKHETMPEYNPEDLQSYHLFSQNGRPGVKSYGALYKGGLNMTNNLPPISVAVPSDVLIDAYRSSSLCVGYYQTHWIRDSGNCSMFFVCSRNRVDAVMACPKDFVWSNRVTNCVPTNSRWDDCANEAKVIRKNLARKKIDVSLEEKQKLLSEKSGDISKEVFISTASAHTTLPTPRIQARKRQMKHRRQQPLTLRRQRLGYRSSIRLKNKLLKRKKYTRHGYVIQLIKKDAGNKENEKLQKDRNDKNMNKEFDRNENIHKKESKLKRLQKLRRNEKRYKYVRHRVDHIGKSMSVGSNIPPTSQTVPTTILTTTENKPLESQILKKRKRRKYRRITHSFVRNRSKHQNSISKSGKDRRYHSKTRQNRIRNNSNHKKSSDEGKLTTTESIVTKWWKISKSFTPGPNDVTEVPDTSTITTTVFANTTHPEMDTDISTPDPRVFVPECGVSAAPLIVGGLPVKRDRWPWVVSLQLTWLSRHMCGATLVHPRWLVTAAHCMAEPDLSHAEDWRVIFENVKSRARIDYVIKHPSFINGDNYPNDIAMLRLKHPADVTGFHIRHACLPPLSWNRSHWDKCWIMGWGEAKEGTVTELKELEVNIWKNSECSARWGWKRILNSHMCVGTGDSGACNGDSGGPLICRRNGYHFLAGVTSWGVYGCQTTGYPGVFVNVASYRKWIDGIIKTHS